MAPYQATMTQTLADDLAAHLFGERCQRLHPLWPLAQRLCAAGAHHSRCRHINGATSRGLACATTGLNSCWCVDVAHGSVMQR